MPDSAPALKEMFNAARYRAMARDLRAVYPRFDEKAFLEIVLHGIEERSLLQRLRRTSEALRETLPQDYPKAVVVLRKLAPRLDHAFTAIVLCDFVGLYGKEHYELSLDALKFFTRFGSGEFAIREFLKADLPRTLGVMRTWADDPNEHVRRLASEGSRPRLPWSFRLEAIVRDPDLTAPILAKLIDDPSLYVRKSIANHLNDISKDHPDWLLGWLRTRDLTRPHARWIANRAVRTLVKRGHPEALALIGATGEAELKVAAFTVKPKHVKLGQPVELAFKATSAATAKQHVVIDYAVHYVKSTGRASAKVFKWKSVDLEAGEAVSLVRMHRIQDFTTRKHYPGRHTVDLIANGAAIAQSTFELRM